MELYAKILEPILNQHFKFGGIDLSIKERIETIGNMQIVIYSNDHNPPHFHVFSKDRSIDAKFTIKECELLSGQITPKQIKIIKNFHNDIKVQIIMEKIWSKKGE